MSPFFSGLLLNRDINKVDQTMEEIRDQMELANEISDVISQPVGFGVEMDEVRRTRPKDLVKFAAGILLSWMLPRSGQRMLRCVLFFFLLSFVLVTDPIVYLMLPPF